MQEAKARENWRLQSRVFRGTWASWDALFRQAAEFTNRLGPDKVVSISHPEDKDDGVVAVWYWEEGNDNA